MNKKNYILNFTLFNLFFISFGCFWEKKETPVHQTEVSQVVENRAPVVELSIEENQQEEETKGDKNSSSSPYGILKTIKEEVTVGRVALGLGALFLGKEAIHQIYYNVAPGDKEALKNHTKDEVKNAIQSKLNEDENALKDLGNSGNASVSFRINTDKEEYVIKPVRLNYSAKSGLLRGPAPLITARGGMAPGEEAMREVLAYETDQIFSGHYGVPETFMTRLVDKKFKPEATKLFKGNPPKWWLEKKGGELAMVQKFVERSEGLIKIEGGTIEYKTGFLARLARNQLDRFNFGLLTLGTDGHFGNFLVKEKNELIPIDFGYSFLLPNVSNNPIRQDWIFLAPISMTPMSEGEYGFLSDMDVNDMSDKITEKAKELARISPRFHDPKSAMKGLKLALIIGKKVGEKKLTQWEWYHMFSPQLARPIHLEKLNPIYALLIKNIEDLIDSKTTDRDKIYQKCIIKNFQYEASILRNCIALEQTRFHLDQSSPFLTIYKQEISKKPFEKVNWGEVEKKVTAELENIELNFVKNYLFMGKYQQIIENALGLKMFRCNRLKALVSNSLFQRDTEQVIHDHTTRTELEDAYCN